MCACSCFAEWFRFICSCEKKRKTKVAGRRMGWIDGRTPHGHCMYFFKTIIILYILETSNFHYFKIIVKNIFPWLQIVPTQIGRQFSLMDGYVCVSSCWFFRCFIHISRLKISSNAKLFLSQCFTAIFERWSCFSIKSATHTSSLNEGLISQ